MASGLLALSLSLSLPSHDGRDAYLEHECSIADVVVEYKYITKKVRRVTKGYSRCCWRRGRSEFRSLRLKTMVEQLPVGPILLISEQMSGYCSHQRGQEKSSIKVSPKDDIEAG